MLSHLGAGLKRCSGERAVFTLRQASHQDENDVMLRSVAPGVGVPGTGLPTFPLTTVGLFPKEIRPYFICSTTTNN